MGTLNLTPSIPITFILNGIPGLEDAHIWISIPFSVFYFITLLGNFSILFIVGKEQTLHKPMYLLFCMLALTDIGMSTSVVPKALVIFWFGFRDITLDGCFTQMFFFHVIVNIQSAILMTMAFDRYIAICDPLRYSTVLTNGRTTKLVLIAVLRAVLLILLGVGLLRGLPFCTNCIIPHTYCEYIAVVKISCGDTTVVRMYSLMVSFVTIGLDLTLIGLSYMLIIKSIFRISSNKAHHKALNTCTAHVCVMLISYTSFLFSNLTHRFGHNISPQIHILLANFYVLVPPMLNPIIYGVKTKELRGRMGKYICRM